MIHEENIIKENGIRYHLDENSSEFYFSIIDVIDNLGLSTDPRNYWKVLKNRLKKGQNELVTECNQLKMKANDGKYYLTDVTNAGSMLKIIQVIAPEKVYLFEEFFNKVEKKNPNYFTNIREEETTEEKLSTEFSDDGEIGIDLYKKDNCLFVKAMIAGVEINNIFISLSCKILTLRISRLNKNNTKNENYLNQELAWGKFSRVVPLPFEVDIDRVETNFSHGLLSIQLFIQDKTRTKIIKIKS